MRNNILMKLSFSKFKTYYYDFNANQFPMKLFSKYISRFLYTMHYTMYFFILTSATF